jgi:hypothetical protein
MFFKKKLKPHPSAITSLLLSAMPAMKRPSSSTTANARPGVRMTLVETMIVYYERRQDMIVVDEVATGTRKTWLEFSKYKNQEWPELVQAVARKLNMNQHYIRLLPGIFVAAASSWKDLGNVWEALDPDTAPNRNSCGRKCSFVLQALDQNDEECPEECCLSHEHKGPCRCQFFGMPGHYHVPA